MTSHGSLKCLFFHSFKTITGIKSSLPLEPEETHKSDESEANVNDDSIFGQAIPGSSECLQLNTP